MSDRTFSFLIATDNHLGFKKDDYLRRKDSFLAFEEVLECARKKDVDFILLGGDLFHENRPSPDIEHKCIKIIRQHMNEGKRKTSFKRISGEFSHSTKLSLANFEDSNLNVSHPIITIHGNHDDPTGPNAQSVCEKLASCGLLNYFGAISSPKNINIEPIILQKGSVKIALYGLGFIPDYKLKLAFDRGEVNFVPPPRDTFNILVVHQNRVPYQKNKVISDDLFPNFFHLLIRGHEHDAKSPELLPGSKMKGVVYQPGSTVSTSISSMEANFKKVGLFTIRLNSNKLDNASRYATEYQLIKLKNCRRILMRDIKQKEIFKYIKVSLGSSKRVPANDFKNLSREYAMKVIEGLLSEFQASKPQPQRVSSSTKQTERSTEVEHFELPLLRIRIEYSSRNERFDELELISQLYPDRVANRDIIMFKKQRLEKSGDGAIDNVTFDDEDGDDEQEDFDYINLSDEKRDTIDVMIENYFKDRDQSGRLQALSLNEYTDAVKGSQEDGNVISRVLAKKKKMIMDQFRKAIVSEEVAESEFHNEKSIENWFLEALRGCPEPDKLAGGDFEDDIVCID